MDVIGQLVSTLDRDRIARQPAAGIGCSLKDFCSHHSESFDGSGDHIHAENWLNDVEELLVTLGCTNEQKVAYAAHKLIREAKRWWQDKKVVLVADLGTRLPFLGKSSSMSSIGTSFLGSCRRRRHESFWTWCKETCR